MSVVEGIMIDGNPWVQVASSAQHQAAGAAPTFPGFASKLCNLQEASWKPARLTGLNKQAE